MLWGVRQDLAKVDEAFCQGDWAEAGPFFHRGASAGDSGQARQTNYEGVT